MAFSEDSPEYRTIIRAFSHLTSAVQHTLISLSSELIATQLISPEIGTSLINGSRDKIERAFELVALVTNKIKQNPQNYHVFVEVLTKNGTCYQEVLQQLSLMYSAKKASTGGPGLQDTTTSHATALTDTSKQIDTVPPTKTEGMLMSRYP